MALGEEKRKREVERRERDGGRRERIERGKKRKDSS